MAPHPAPLSRIRWRGSKTKAVAALFLVYLAGCSAHVQRAEPNPSRFQGGSFVAPPKAPSLGEIVPAQSLPASDEELWIIEKPTAPVAANNQNGAASTQLISGSGMLLLVHGATLTPLPLKQTDVRANIDGCIASVDVHQRFENPSTELSEVVYSFPLPQNGAVNDFVMSVGNRHIRGIVRERAEAEKIYQEALGQGFLASLIVEQSPNVFVQRVANLEPGKQIDVEMRYFHTLPYRDGWFEYEFPLITGLRGRSAPAANRDGRNVAILPMRS
jgi:hypothetical protein